MASKVPFYRLYLREPIRKLLGINLLNKKIYIYTVNHVTYLSTNMIPKRSTFTILNVILGNSAWYIDIPVKLTEYEPVGYSIVNTNGAVLKLTKKIK